MVNPIFQQDEELLLNPFGSRYLSSDTGAYTDVNSNEFIVQEDAVISVLTGGDASISENSIDYKTSMNLSGVTLKKGALIVAPVGEAFKSITIDSGSVMAYNCVVGGTKPGSFVGLLDLYPDAAAAYSLRKLRADYEGAAIRVRRSSDNTEQDIGFVDNELDTASLLSFVGAGDGFVRIWYDQSGGGGGNDAVSLAASSQPIIVSSGILELLNGKPSVNFINGADRMNLINTFEVSSNFTVFNTNTYANVNYIWGSDSPFSSGLISGGTAGGVNGVSAFSDPNFITYNNLEDAAQRLAVLIQNENTNLDVNSAGLVSAPNIGEVWAEILGNRSPTLQFSVRGNIQECIFFSDDKLATKADIETNINDYYNVY